MRLKRETQVAFCVLNANAKSQNAKIYEDKRDLYCMCHIHPHRYIPFQRIEGHRKCCHECSLGVYQVIEFLLYVPSEALLLYQI